jgi:peptidyl-prolyl cis-trans isomerase B (cyclophilin B)
MGKIQKIREQKKIEAQLQVEFKKKKNKKIFSIVASATIVLIIIIVATFYIIRLSGPAKIIGVTIETEKGNIELELNREAAPNTVDNFVKLAQEGFYDEIRFHRVVKDFVIQAGDPLSKDDDINNDGTGGPGYTFNDEINPRSLGVDEETINALGQQGYKFNYLLKSISHTAGVISMANSGPNTNGSQFFITLKDVTELDGRYTAFGKVIVGMDVVQNIQQGDIINTVIIK